MGVAVLKSAVGLPGKTGNSKQVKNKPADIETLRRMLTANGYKLPETGGFDAKLAACIKGAQKKAGIKAQDGVVIPGDKTDKSLKAKYLLIEKRAANVKMVVFKIRGKTYELTPEQYEKSKADLLKKIEAPTKLLINRFDHSMEHYRFYLDTATMKNGIQDAFWQAAISTVARVKLPDIKVQGKAHDARNALDIALKRKDLAAYCKAMRTAEKDINAFIKEFNAYVKKMNGGGEKLEGGLKVVSSTAFSAAEILAVPVIMTYTRLPPDKAYLVSKTASAGIESIATDLGKQIAGQDVSFKGSAGRASYAMAKEVVIGLVGSKIKLKGPLLTKTMKALSPAITKAFPFVPKGSAQRFAARYIEGFGEDALKSIMENLVKAVEKWLKSGKPPSGSDVEKLLTDAVKSAALGGLTNNLGKFNTNWAKKNEQVLRGKLIPMAFKKIDSKHVVDAAKREILLKSIMGKIEGKALSYGYDKVFETATGHESANALTGMAEKALREDRSITAEIEAMIADEVKKVGKK